MQAQDVAHRAVQGQGAHQRGGSHQLSREKTSLRKLPGSGRALQRSCFRVRLADLVAASVDVPAAAPASNGIDHVIGRIVSFLVLHTAGSQRGRVLAHVRLYSPVPFREMKTAAAAVETELWHHNYTFKITSTLRRTSCPCT